MKWTSSSLFRLLELYDQATDMNNYRIKDPTPFAKQFMVEKFNQEFGLDIIYKFFKEKLDTMKKVQEIRRASKFNWYIYRLIPLHLRSMLLNHGGKIVK